MTAEPDWLPQPPVTHGTLKPRAPTKEIPTGVAPADVFDLLDHLGIGSGDVMW